MGNAVVPVLMSVILRGVLVVPTTSIHRIQECHVAAYHILWDLVHTLLADDRGSASTKGAAA